MTLSSVFIFDASKTPNIEAGEIVAPADAHLLYHYPSTNATTEERVFAALMQGVLDFARYCAGSPGDCPDTIDHSVIQMESHWIVMRKVETAFVLAMVWKRGGGSTFLKSVFDMFYDYYLLLHGSLRDQVNGGHLFADTFDDFIPTFVAAELGNELSQKLVYGKIRYAQVERHSFIALHAIGMELLVEYPTFVTDFAIAFNGNLISSSVEPLALAPLYNYLVVMSGSGGVSNTKLRNLPYGRIGTPSILPGGGSSSFGRSNRSGAFLFGPSGDEGNAFCPLVYFKTGNSTTERRYLCVFYFDELMFVVLLSRVDEPSIFSKLTHHISSNLELQREILPKVRHELGASEVGSSGMFDFTYDNPVNASYITQSSKKQASTKSGSRFGLMSISNPFAARATGHVQEAKLLQREALKTHITAMLHEDPGITDVCVKTSTGEGWLVGKKSVSNREILFDLSHDPKLPYWKATEEVDAFLAAQFSSAML